MAKNNSTTSGIENFDSELQNAIQCTRGSASFAGFCRTQFSSNISFETLVLKVETAMWTEDGATRAYSDAEKAEGKHAIQMVRSRIKPEDVRKIVKAAKVAAEKAEKGSGEKVTSKTLGLKSQQARTLKGSRIIVLRMIAIGIIIHLRLRNALDAKDEQHKSAAAMCPVLTEEMSYGKALAALMDHKIVQQIEKTVKGKKVKTNIVHPSLNSQFDSVIEDDSLKLGETTSFYLALRQITRQMQDWAPAKKLKSLTDSQLADKRKVDRKVTEETERATNHITAALPDANKSGRLTKLNSLADMAERELSTKKFKLEIPRKKTVKDGIAAIVNLPKARENFALGKQKSSVLRAWTNA